MFAKKFYIVMLAAVGMLACTAAPAMAQAAPAASDDKGLLPMIPPDAIFFVEHRGHTAIHDVFLQSNLGKMYKDEAITQFVQDTRVQFGKMIMKEIFDSPNVKTDPAELQRTLHKVLKPFWYKPAAMFVVLTDGKMDDAPGMGFICAMDEKSRAEAKPALDSLMSIGVPSAGMGQRQAFKWKTDKLEWLGVAKSHSQWEADPAGGPGKMTSKEWTLSPNVEKQADELKDKSLFMTCWTEKHLLVATNLSAAAALGKATAKPDANKDKNESLARIMKKTALKDWAFRWFVDAEAFQKAIKDKDHGGEMVKLMKSIGLPHVGGIGGTTGYADNVYTRLTYIDAPNSGGGVFGILKLDGDYKKALGMMPRQTTFVLAGQLDGPKCVALVRRIALAAAGEKAGARDETRKHIEKVETTHTVVEFNIADGESTPASKPATQPAEEPKLSEEASKTIAQMEKLLAAGNGHAGVYVTDIQAMMGMMGGGGAPVGMVLDIKDKAKATAAIDELVKLAGITEGTRPVMNPNDPPGTVPPEPPKEYRKVKIRYLSEMVRLGVMEDRVVLAMSSDAFKAAVDAALDKNGAPDPDSQQAKLLQLCGKGSAAFSMDLAVLAKLGWPLLSQAMENPEATEHMPLASLPSTEKLVSFLGPEVAVFQPDQGGVLLKSRGKIPFSTKLIAGYPLMMFVMMGGF
jgi:hypothetical protein